MWKAVWSLMGIEAAILGLWHVYKTLREAKFHREMAIAAKEASSAVNEKAVAAAAAIEDVDNEKDKKMQEHDNVSDTSSLQDSERLRFRGYNTDYFGLFGLGSVVVVTLLFLVFLGCLVSDYCK